MSKNNKSKQQLKIVLKHMNGIPKCGNRKHFLKLSCAGGECETTKSEHEYKDFALKEATNLLDELSTISKKGD